MEGDIASQYVKLYSYACFIDVHSTLTYILCYLHIRLFCVKVETKLITCRMIDTWPANLNQVINLQGRGQKKPPPFAHVC